MDGTDGTTHQGHNSARTASSQMERMDPIHPILNVNENPVETVLTPVTMDPNLNEFAELPY